MTPEVQHHETTSSQQKTPNIIQVSSLIYGVMAIVGLILMQYAHQNFGTAVVVPQNDFSGPKLLAIGLLSGGVLLCVSYFFELYLPSYRYFRSIMMQTLGRVSIPAGIYLALVSAIGEELFFRGGIQPFAGILLTSIIFGLMHMGPDGGFSSWSVWAFLAAVILGWSFEATKSIWPAMIGHFMVNAYGILRLRSEFRRFNQDNSKSKLDDAAQSS